jgi:hypothetical protein
MHATIIAALLLPALALGKPARYVTRDLPAFQLDCAWATAVAEDGLRTGTIIAFNPDADASSSCHNVPAVLGGITHIQFTTAPTCTKFELFE